MKFVRGFLYAYFILASVATALFINTLGLFSGDYWLFFYGQYVSLVQANGVYFLGTAFSEAATAWRDTLSFDKK